MARRRNDRIEAALTPLEYPEDSMWPLMSATALRHHRTKVEAAFVRRLRRLVPGVETTPGVLEALIVDGAPPVCWLAAEIRNHQLFWDGMTPRGGGLPAGIVAGRIRAAFGEFSAMKAAFNEQASRHIGSGWAWLALDDDGRMVCSVTRTDAHPLRDGHWPLLCCDLWEHAHYLDHGHNRDHYLETWWRFVDWEHVGQRLREARAATSIHLG